MHISECGWAFYCSLNCFTSCVDVRRFAFCAFIGGTFCSSSHAIAVLHATPNGVVWLVCPMQCAPTSAVREHTSFTAIICCTPTALWSLMWLTAPVWLEPSLYTSLGLHRQSFKIFRLMEQNFVVDFLLMIWATSRKHTLSSVLWRLCMWCCNCALSFASHFYYTLRSLSTTIPLLHQIQPRILCVALVCCYTFYYPFLGTSCLQFCDSFY